eukprot:352201_1
MEQFGSGLCDICADGCSGCLCSHFCLPCYFAQTRNMFDQSNCLFNLFCLGPVAVRNIIREGYGIEGGCLGDVCTTLFCPCCVGIQLRAEVNKRGQVTDQKAVYVRVADNGV